MIGITLNLLRENINVKENKMNKELLKLKYQYRINLLTSRGEEMNRGIIHKLQRKLRRLDVE